MLNGTEFNVVMRDVAWVYNRIPVYVKYTRIFSKAHGVAMETGYCSNLAR
jgi:hypothetical protein